MFRQQKFAHSKFYCRGVSHEMQRFWTIFLSGPKACPPQKRKFYFYCRLAVSEIFKDPPKYPVKRHRTTLRGYFYFLRLCSASRGYFHQKSLQRFLGSDPGPAQASRVRRGPVQIRNAPCLTAFRTHPGPDVRAHPGPSWSHPGPERSFQDRAWTSRNRLL